MSYNLQQRLNAFVSGECSPEAFMQELVVFCDSSPDSAWDVLSLIDQYHRRGKLSADQYRKITHKIERHVLLVANDPAIATDRQPPVPPVVELMRKVPPSAGDRHKARAKLQRYRQRIARLADIGRRYRSELSRAQGDLANARTEAARYLEQLKAKECRRTVLELPAREPEDTLLPRDDRRRALQFRTLKIASWFALVLVLVALAPYRESPPPVSAVRVSAPEAAAPMSPDPDPAVIALSSDRYVVFPGQTQASILVSRSSGGRGEVNFVWRAQGSGARPGKDFVFGKPKLAQLSEGTESLELSIPILRNPSRKHTEMFYVELRDPGDGALLGAIRRATVFIMPSA